MSYPLITISATTEGGHYFSPHPSIVLHKIFIYSYFKLHNMKHSFFFLLFMLISLAGIAQKNEPLSNKANASTQEATSPEEFIFPDHIKFTKKDLNERVQKKTKALTKCLQKLADKKEPDYTKEIGITMKLFNNDDRKMVTVTSKKNPAPVTKPIRKYLNDLAHLHYDKVTILWHNAEYVSNFTKQPDGTYTALVAFEQEFTGSMGGEFNYTYHDVTQKRIEVTVKVWDKLENGVITKSYMDVFLGNIGVTEE